ncbi:non-oxidative hydroxyarylic acid decarboxylases subunit D [Streptomyces sp. NPDC093984]|uniref:non-oxidative hydroxyarylic acid decarboxylases subunit D n=1 Tax=Streptomyces sp. NPDC093984 TaxID=3366052 RepID=UPI00381E5C9D
MPVRSRKNCLYTWRTTEPAGDAGRDAYPERFRMTEADIAERHRGARRTAAALLILHRFVTV